MPRASTVHAVIAIGIDLGKNTLHMIGLDSSGAIVLREKVSRPFSVLRKIRLLLRKASCMPILNE